MAENRPAPRRRSRVSEQAQHFDTAQAAYPSGEMAYSYEEENGNQHPQTADMPQRDMSFSHHGYTFSNEHGSGEQTPDYSAYYSRESAGQEEAGESAFAAPVRLNYYGYESQLKPLADEAPSEEVNHIYHPRQATWADEERQEALAQSELGYQVHADEAPARKKKKKKKKRRHPVRTVFLTLLVLGLLAAGVFLLWEPLMGWIEEEEILPQPTEDPFEVVVTPEPIKAYDAAPKEEIPSAAQAAISQLSGNVQLEAHIVTDSHVVARHQRDNGSYDFYLFTSPKGRLLCYFEGLNALDMIPQEGGGFYVNQEPYLISPSGSALVRVTDLERQLGEKLRLHPMYRGWAIAESAEDGSANYINQSGQVLSTLWFSRTFPFTGDYTLAYVDTGATADEDQRYLLYVLGRDGSMSRWIAANDMQDTVAAISGMAYMSDGKLYQLPDTSAPVLTTPRIDAYPDCDAMVVQDPVTGKYGLLVHGEQHYDCVYDVIQPVASDIRWAEKTLEAGNAVLRIRVVSEAGYPQPLSHSFMLEKDGQREYVALSASSSYPIRLDGEF